MEGWSHLIHGWLHLGLKSRSASLKVNLLEINILSDLGGNFTLKVAKASEAISNVDSSTYLKKSLNWLEKRTILASGSCRIHSLSIIPQRRAICGASYLKHKQERKQNSYSTNEIHQRHHKHQFSSADHRNTDTICHSSFEHHSFNPRTAMCWALCQMLGTQEHTGRSLSLQPQHFSEGVFVGRKKLHRNIKVISYTLKCCESWRQ